MGIAAGVARGAGVVPDKSPAGRIDYLVMALFVLMMLTGSSLLSIVQPMVAKMLFPTYGGSPMVWNTSVLFLQIALVAGAAIAWFSERLFRGRRQPPIEVVLAIASMLTFPIALPAWSEPRGAVPAAIRLLLVLTTVVGAPALALAMTGSVVRRWYSRSGLPRSTDPYFFGAIGSIGGIFALLGYPLLIEPAVDIAAQTRWWAIGYGAFAVLVAVCGLITRFRFVKSTRQAMNARQAMDAETGQMGRPSWRCRMRWMVLAFVPSALMLSTTTRLSTTMAPVPSILVMPLVLYLSTFVLAFGTRKHGWVSRAAWAAAIGAAVVPWAVHLLGGRDAGSAILLAFFLGACLACHGLLARDRPSPRRLNEFLLVTSFGAALGGAFGGLVGPNVLGPGAELPPVAAILAVLPLVASRRPDASAPQRLPGAGLLVKAFLLAVPLCSALACLEFGAKALLIAGICWVAWCVLGLRRPRMMAIGVALTTAVLVWYEGSAVSIRMPTFFGDYQIRQDNGWNVLHDGWTMRGYQSPDVALRTTPVAYYGKSGPLGDVFASYGGRSGSIAVIGLGTGAVAGYGRPGQQMDFYEIDLAAIKVALQEFTYLANSKAKIGMVNGDGRTALSRMPDGSYRLIIVDASTFGTTPIHLLTREALQTYARKLAPGGVVAVNVTNSRLDLPDMLGATASAAGLASLAGRGDADPHRIFRASTWVAIAQTEADLQPLRAKPWRWRAPRPGSPEWTDAHVSLSGVFTFRRY
jgi:hypothetical protein